MLSATTLKNHTLSRHIVDTIVSYKMKLTSDLNLSVALWLRADLLRLAPPASPVGVVSPLLAAAAALDLLELPLPAFLCLHAQINDTTIEREAKAV
jgi:hypothetical protein